MMGETSAFPILQAALHGKRARNMAGTKESIATPLENYVLPEGGLEEGGRGSLDQLDLALPAAVAGND